jgi:uncharacterized membrane protein
VVVSTLLISTAQILYKIGVNNLRLDLMDILRNWHLIGGFALYIFSAFMVTLAFKKGELSILFPFIALSYVWVCFMAQAMLHEQMNMWKWLGIASIVAGVTFIGLGNERAAQSGFTGEER